VAGDEVERLSRSLDEALEQQTAPSEILRAISSSPTDLQPVLDAVSENAARVCEASDAVILLVEGTQLRAAAYHGLAFAAAVDRPVTRDGVAGRAVIDRATIHLPDVRERSSLAASLYQPPEARRRAVEQGDHHESRRFPRRQHHVGAVRVP
jgi:hypothetical protein